MSGAQSHNSKSIADKPREKFSMPQKPVDATGIKHAVNPGKSTMQRVENLSKFEELYKMFSAIKRRNEMQNFAIPPQIYMRSDLKQEEKQNLLEEDRNLMNSLSLDSRAGVNNTFISKSVIREAEKVFLEDRETFLWVEVFNNNMYLAVTRSTGNRKNPFEVVYFQYDRTYELNDDISNSDIFNGIGVSIQAYLTNGYIQTEFGDQNSIPIIFCFSDFAESNSPLEEIATHVWDRSTFKGEIVGKNYCREFARALQLIDSKKKIEFTTISPLHSGNFLSYYCFDTFDKNKRPAANYNFLEGLSIQEFLDCKKIEAYEIKETNLTKIYPDSVTKGKDSKSMIISNSYFRIGQNDGFERSVIYKYLTENERNYFDQNSEEVRYLFSRIASPFKLAQLLQTYIRNHPLFLNNEKLEEKPIVDLKRFDYFLQTEYKDHGSILHPYTFELIGKEINNFAKFIMKRCLSFSALALLSAIERKYYTQIEPKYPAGSSPIVRISMREDDRGLAKTFEESIVKYLNNGAEIFWTQRRKDLKPPTFELISAFNSMFSGSHVYTKYLRTLIPRDYWDEHEDETNSEERKERKRKYQIAWDARMKEIEKFNELAKQAMNNIATMESSKEIDFSQPEDKQDLKSTLEKMFGFGDIGKIEAVYITPAPTSVNNSQTKASTISQEHIQSNDANLESEKVFIPKIPQRLESQEPVLIPSISDNSRESKVNSKIGLTNTENCSNRIKKEDYEKAFEILALRKAQPFLSCCEVPQLFKAFTTVCDYRIQNSTSKIETCNLYCLQDVLISLTSRESIELDELDQLFSDYTLLFCDCDDCKCGKQCMKNPTSTELENIEYNRYIYYQTALSIISGIGDLESIEAKDVQLISNSFSRIANYLIDEGINLEQSHLAKRALDELQEKNEITRTNLIALLKDHLGALDCVVLRDYKEERAADRNIGINESKKKRAARIRNIFKYKEAMASFNNLISKSSEDISKILEQIGVILTYHIKESRSYTESFLSFHAKVEFDKLCEGVDDPLKHLKDVMKKYLARRKAMKGGHYHENDENRALLKGGKNPTIKGGKNKRRARK